MPNLPNGEFRDQPLGNLWLGRELFSHLRDGVFESFLLRVGILQVEPETRIQLLLDTLSILKIFIWILGPALLLFIGKVDIRTIWPSELLSKAGRYPSLTANIDIDPFHIIEDVGQNLNARTTIANQCHSFAFKSCILGPSCRMKHMPLERLPSWDGWPFPVIEATSSINQDITFFNKRLSGLPILVDSIADHQLSAISRDTFNFPLLTFFNPFGLDDLVRNPDVLTETVLIGDCFYVRMDVFPGGIIALEIRARCPGVLKEC